LNKINLARYQEMNAKKAKSQKIDEKLKKEQAIDELFREQVLLFRLK
jgi:hypothetical protein